MPRVWIERETAGMETDNGDDWLSDITCMQYIEMVGKRNSVLGRSPKKLRHGSQEYKTGISA